MNKYPYIGKNSNLCGDFSIAIFYGEKRGALLENTIDDIPLHKHLHNFNESEFENITADYLRNTYGKVEGKEHAEFIVKLAEGAGFKVRLNYEGGKSYFNFYDESIVDFWNDEVTSSANGEKLITLPIPPKESEEWPVVGSEVLTLSDSKAIVLAIDKDEAWVKYNDESNRYGYASVRTATLKKPPTPEEDLRDELIDMTIKSMSDDNYDLPHNAYYLVSAIMNKYNIKKKPE